MNKAEQLFRSLFDSDCDYSAFKLANQVMPDSISEVIDGQLEEEDFIHVVHKNNNKYLIVVDDKPSWIQYNKGRDIALFLWAVGDARADSLTREGGKPTKVAIDFGDVVVFTYGHDDTEEVVWEELFPESCTPDPDPIGMATAIVDTEIKDWSFLNRLKTAE